MQLVPGVRYSFLQRQFRHIKASLHGVYKDCYVIAKSKWHDYLAIGQFRGSLDRMKDRRQYSLALVVSVGATLLLTVLVASCNVAPSTASIDEPVQIDTTEVDPELANSVAEMLELINATPFSSSLRGRLAMMYEVNHFPDAALGMYEQAALLDPQEFSWWYFGALIDKKQGNFDAAIEKIKRAIAIDPGYVPAHLHQGSWLLEQNRYDEAVAAYNEAASLGAGSPAAVGLAQVYLREDSFQAVIDVLTPYAQNLPHPQIWRLLAAAYAPLGLEQEAEVARALGQEAIPLLWLDPIRQRPNKYIRGFGRRLAYAQSLLSAERYAEALRELERLQAIRPDDEILLNNLSVAYDKSGQFDKAVQTLERGIELAPNQFRFYVYLGDLLYRAGGNEEAIDLFNRSLQINDRNAEAYERLGSVLMRLERFSEAMSAFEKAIEFGHSNVAGIRLRMGTIQGYQENWDEAIDQFSQVVRLEPANVDGHVFLLHALVGDNRLQEAEAALQWAARLGIDSQSLQPVVDAISQKNGQVDPQSP